MKSFLRCVPMFFCLCAGCETQSDQRSGKPDSFGSDGDSNNVVAVGLESAFGSPIPFSIGNEAPQPFFDPPKRLIEVRFQCQVSAALFAKHFKVVGWQKTNIPRSIAELAPGFDYPTPQRVATSFERTVSGWDYRLIRAWESEEILMIAVLSEAHARYKANGLDY